MYMDIAKDIIKAFIWVIVGVAVGLVIVLACTREKEVAWGEWTQMIRESNTVSFVQVGLREDGVLVWRRKGK